MYRSDIFLFLTLLTAHVNLHKIEAWWVFILEKRASPNKSIELELSLTDTYYSQSNSSAINLNFRVQYIYILGI